MRKLEGRRCVSKHEGERNGSSSSFARAFELAEALRMRAPQDEDEDEAA
jgi:hypothetical protein